VCPPRPVGVGSAAEERHHLRSEEMRNRKEHATWSPSATDLPLVNEDYVREKLLKAVDALATGTGAVQQRLLSAALAMSTLRPTDFVDDESRAQFAAIREMLTRHEPRAGEGRIRATLARLSDDEARSVAQLIVELDAHYRPLWFFAERSIRDRAEGRIGLPD
jgi:hypothetical protein